MRVPLAGPQRILKRAHVCDLRLESVMVNFVSQPDWPRGAQRAG